MIVTWIFLWGRLFSEFIKKNSRNSIISPSKPRKVQSVCCQSLRRRSNELFPSLTREASVPHKSWITGAHCQNLIFPGFQESRPFLSLIPSISNRNRFTTYWTQCTRSITVYIIIFSFFNMLNFSLSTSVSFSQPTGRTIDSAIRVQINLQVRLPTSKRFGRATVFPVLWYEFVSSKQRSISFQHG